MIACAAYGHTPPQKVHAAATACRERIADHAALDASLEAGALSRMARFRLARPAHADLSNILARSAEQSGAEGRRRDAAILVAAMRQVAAGPQGPLTRERRELRRGLRGFHIRYAPSTPAVARVRRPV